ncbi:hypothetical protein EVAR_97954_1, partial [Eumeta japonica]
PNCTRSDITLIRGDVRKGRGRAHIRIDIDKPRPDGRHINHNLHSHGQVTTLIYVQFHGGEHEVQTRGGVRGPHRAGRGIETTAAIDWRAVHEACPAARKMCKVRGRVD